MKKNDPNNFVFFYLKKQIRNSKFVIHNYEEENLNYFVSSIKKFHPNSKIIQCTDFKFKYKLSSLNILLKFSYL